MEQIILSGILPVMGCRGQGYKKRKLYLWGCFVGGADIYMRDGLYLSGKGAAVFADELSEAVESGMGSIKNIFGSKHCLN